MFIQSAGQSFLRNLYVTEKEVTKSNQQELLLVSYSVTWQHQLWKKEARIKQRSIKSMQQKK